MADSLLQITIGVQDEDPTRFADRVLGTTGDAHSKDGRTRLLREVGGLLSRPHKVMARVDSITRGSSSGQLVADITDATAGDVLDIYIPGVSVIRISFVATGADAGQGEVNLDAASDTALGDEFVDVFTEHPILKQYFTASNSTGTVTVTPRDPGTWCDAVTFTEIVTSNSPFAPTSPTGGDDIFDQPTMDIVFGTPDIVADDTISIGNYEYIWKASASADNEITLSTTEATAATNFAAKINADTRWTGILSASVATATVTLTFLADPRLCQHILVTYAETNAGSVVPAGTVIITGAEAPLLGTTVTGGSTTRTWGGAGTK